MLEEPILRITCFGCGISEEIELIKTLQPRIYRIPNLWECEWYEADGKQYCQDCWDEGDTPSETLSAAERNPSLCGRK